jgi:dTDP-4-dehydrorhamnose 3,5-epimerase
MEIIPTDFDGLKILRPRIFTDLRGSFVKTFHAPTFLTAGLDFDPREEFFSVSHQNVLRGMHFQLPPHTQARLVSCLTGRILDVVVDLRRDKLTFGRSWSWELSAAAREILFIPEGLAHGFLSLEDNTLVNYVASQSHSPAQDTGIAWNSFAFDWPVQTPILSERDKQFPALSEFHSPF